MKNKYIAKLYFGNKDVMDMAGDDVEKLYIWLLTQANGKMGDVHGEIIDSKTQEVVKQFRKCPPE